MLVPNGINGQKVGVLGLGLSGLAALAALDTAGAETFAYDDILGAADLPQIAITDWQSWPWDELSMLVISPGIPHLHPKPHPAALMAALHVVPIVSEVELAFRAYPTSRIVAVTGTNGKSTTTALIGHCLQHAGIPVAVGGNIGKAACALNDPGATGVIVLELSSYQLETTPSLATDVAVLLNISPDHLDRHDGMAGYVAAKSSILDRLRDGGTAVLGIGDAYVRDLASTYEMRGTHILRADPQHAPIAQQNSPALAGLHNAENAAAAAAAVRCFGVYEDTINAAIGTFESLPHRMQTVASYGKIRFVNDSKATNGVAAAKALGAFEDIYWVAGGVAKQDGIEPTIPYLSTVKKVYLIGSSADSFAARLASHCPTKVCGDLDTATRAAFTDAKLSSNGGIVLLAPAAASFDQFKNFSARGDAFAGLARDLCSSAENQQGGHYA
jgi:UDP-N-acetylmuramoylalanine--D-glutamate ligase